jgi:hypothetical protein
VRNQRLSFELMLIPVFTGMIDAMAHQGGILRRGTELFEARELRIHVDKTFPLEARRRGPCAGSLGENQRQGRPDGGLRFEVINVGWAERSEAQQAAFGLSLGFALLTPTYMN